MEFFAVILFTVTTWATPGPNNTMLLTSGLNYGIQRSLPHYLGIILGFPTMFVAIGLGLARLFDQFPLLHSLLKVSGALYLSYLAWRIATTPISDLSAGKGKPFTFFQAAAFQWVNPKAWVMAIGAIATYTVVGSQYEIQVVTIALIFLIFGAPCSLLWLWFGASLKRFLQRPNSVKRFNYAMAALLMTSLMPAFTELLVQFKV